MILIPDTNTLHVMKEGNVSVENIKLRVMSNMIITKPKISFDGNKYYKFVAGMKIPVKYHNVTMLHMIFKCEIAGAVKIYQAEQLPLIVYTFVGERVEDVYPVAIQSVIDKENNILNRLAILEQLAEYGNL